MKEKIIAIVLLLTILSAVTSNTFMLNRQIETFTDLINNLDIHDSFALENVQKIHDNYKQKKDFISITVSHDDLTSLDECFIELSGYIKEGNTAEAEITKNRLLFYLEHIRRLSGFNIDSII